jgi:hypothetical protein
MLKPFTLSLSLAVALSFTGVCKAGGLFHGGDGCYASAQAPAVSPQAPCPSPQGECVPACKPKCSLFSGMGHKMSCGFNNLCARLKPKPKCYTYEWVLKKKRVWGCHGNCGSPSCETCGVYPSGQGYPSPQGGYTSPQYGSGQVATGAYQPTTGTAPAVGGDEAPPAPEVAPATPSTPAPTAPVPPPPGATSGLLFSTPSGN